jgi:hypothetical protein
MPDLPPAVMAPLPRTAPVAIALALALVAGGCAGGNYPSLERRPAELQYAQPTSTPAAPAGPQTPDPAIVSQVDTLRSDVIRASAAFAKAAKEAEHLAQAAHGTAVGSEAWAAATIATAALDSAHSQTAVPLGELDALQARMAVTAADSGLARDAASYAVIAHADSDVGAMLESENARIAALHRTSGD